MKLEIFSQGNPDFASLNPAYRQRFFPRLLPPGHSL
jgi:hypothetical protein